MTKPVFGKYTFNYYGRDFELKIMSNEDSNDIEFIAPKSKRKVAIKWSEQGRCYNIVEYDEFGNPNSAGTQHKVTAREGAIDTACTRLLAIAGKL